MEAHHPHHVTHKKKWTEYLLEFFMLFLAVFLGFVAENIRENIVEHERAKHYARSLYRDMVQDTTRLSEAINIYTEVAYKIDTLRNLVRGKEIKDIPDGAIYYYSRFAFRHWGFSSNDATLQQLKNAGSLRYFGNYKLEDAIGQYDNWLRWMDAALVNDRDNLQMGNAYRLQLFDANILDSVMSYSLPRDFINGFMKRTHTLVSYDKIKWTEYFNFTAARSAALKRLMQISCLPALEQARKVIALLKKEYHLENE